MSHDSSIFVDRQLSRCMIVRCDCKLFLSIEQKRQPRSLLVILDDLESRFPYVRCKATPISPKSYWHEDGCGKSQIWRNIISNRPRCSISRRALAKRADNHCIRHHNNKRCHDFLSDASVWLLETLQVWIFQHSKQRPEQAKHALCQRFQHLARGAAAALANKRH